MGVGTLELLEALADLCGDRTALARDPHDVVTAHRLDRALHNGQSACVDGDHAAGDPIEFDLEDNERLLLRCGLVEWGGPAKCTEELAVAMGFGSVSNLFAEARRLIDAIESSRPLSRLDWLRAVLATEIVFASDLVGSGTDWSITTGLSDDQSLVTLRSIQQKVTGELRSLIGNGLGTRLDQS